MFGKLQRNMREDIFNFLSTSESNSQFRGLWQRKDSGFEFLAKLKALPTMNYLSPSGNKDQLFLLWLLHSLHFSLRSTSSRELWTHLHVLRDHLGQISQFRPKWEQHPRMSLVTGCPGTSGTGGHIPGKGLVPQLQPELRSPCPSESPPPHPPVLVTREN